MQSIRVDFKQEKNPLLKYIHHVKYTLSNELLCDYILGNSSMCIGVLYVSLNYHILYPQYLACRMRELGEGYKVRLVLCYVNMEECEETILELNKLCFQNRYTLILAWSLEEAARYIESFHIYEGRSASHIQEKVENEFMPLMVKALTSVQGVNRSDVSTLLLSFGSLEDISQASELQLLLCPGIGYKKAKRLHSVLHTNFGDS